MGNKGFIHASMVKFVCGWSEEELGIETYPVSSNEIVLPKLPEVGIRVGVGVDSSIGVLVPTPTLPIGVTVNPESGLVSPTPIAVWEKRPPWLFVPNREFLKEVENSAKEIKIRIVKVKTRLK